MEGLKGSQGFLTIILSLLSQLLDVPNFSDLISHPSSGSKDKSKGQDSSLVKRNVFSDLASAAKGLLQGNSESCAAEEEIFGKPLPETIPNKLLNVLKFLNKYVHLEGLFRVNGSKKRINDLKKILDTQGNLIDWENQETFTAHDAASLLKLYLSELPEPLLLNRYLEVHMVIAKIPNTDPKKIKCLQLLLLLLPEHNRLLFKLIIDLLEEVARNPYNLMDDHNLGVVFAPALLKPQDIDEAATCLGGGATDRLDDLHSYVAFVISNAEFLFAIPSEVQEISEKYKQRLENGEIEDDITIDIEGKCVKLDSDTAKEVMYRETKTQLMDLYRSYGTMAESKHKQTMIKKFHKTYPHIVQEVNQQSHSPIIHSKKIGLHHSLARMLSTKRSSITSIPGSPSTPSCSTPRPAFSSTPHHDTTPVSSLPKASLLSSLSCVNTPPRIGTKRKVFEILQQSPTIPRHYQGHDDAEDMETDMMPAHKRRRNNNIEPIEMISRENSDSETDSPMELTYRDLGETGSYREYFV